MASERQRQTQAQRAEIVFALYYQLRPQRSLRRLYQQLRVLGVRIGQATLKRYSARFDWQRRISDLETEAIQRQRERALGELLAMEDRHAQLGRAMQGAGGSALRTLMNSQPRLARMKGADIARLVEAGLKAERRAVGEAADRRDISLEIWNVVTTEMVALFNEVNSEPESEARAGLFARAVDRLVDTHLAEVTKEEGVLRGR